MWFISRFFADDSAQAEAEPSWRRQCSKTNAILILLGIEHILFVNPPTLASAPKRRLYGLPSL